MADELYGGSLTSFADSMAEEIDRALVDARAEAGKEAPPDDEDRRILFIAIARGVIAHLAKKEKAFQIAISTTPSTVTPSIKVRQP